jgi:hypothetical protein
MVICFEEEAHTVSTHVALFLSAVILMKYLRKSSGPSLSSRSGPFCHRPSFDVSWHLSSDLRLCQYAYWLFHSQAAFRRMCYFSTSFLICKAPRLELDVVIAEVK